MTATHIRTPTTTLIQFTLLFQLAVSLVSAAPDDNASDTAKSIFNSADGIEIGGSIFAVFAIVAGAIICLAGYKLFRPALFAVGFAFGGVLIAMAAEEIFKHKSWVNTASWIAFIIGGLIIGGLVISLYKLSIFVAGAVAGVLLATMINTSFGYKIYPNHPNVVLIVLAVAIGLVGGVLAFKLEKPVLVVATSLIGAGLLVWGIGYFAGDFPSPSDLKQFATQDMNGDWVYDIPTAWWAYLASILVLFALGMFVQFRKTGRGDNYHRSHAVPSRTAADADHQSEFSAVHTPQKDRNVQYGDPAAHA
jgi:MFS family permease